MYELKTAIAAKLATLRSCPTSDRTSQAAMGDQDEFKSALALEPVIYGGSLTHYWTEQLVLAVQQHLVLKS